MTKGKHMHRLVSVVLLSALTATACAGGGSDERSTAPLDAASTTSAAAASTTTSSTTTTSTSPEPSLPWRQVETGEDCVCSDGSPYRYWVRNANPDQVMLFFDGGGACFSAETCDPNGNPTYSIQANDQPNDFDTGVFDFDNPENPLADWTMIFMPYCTGDVHIGTNAAHDYGDGITVNHTGFLNASKGLEHLVRDYANAAQVLVTGSSAGGVPAPLFAGLAAEALPDADILSLPDASGGYPSNPILNGVIGGLWGTVGAVPNWTSTEAVTAVEMGIPDLYAYAGTEFPQIRWARFDHAYDDVQSTFSALAGLEDSSVRAVLDVNEDLAESAGIDLPVYVAPGTDHTILGTEAFYELEVEGVRFVDWMTDFIAGATIQDVVCTECEDPAG